MTKDKERAWFKIKRLKNLTKSEERGMVQYVTNENTNLFIVYPTTMKVQYFQGVTSLDSLLECRWKRRRKF